MYLVYMIVDIFIMFNYTASLWSSNISLLQCYGACLAEGELQCCEGGNWWWQSSVWYCRHMVDMGMYCITIYGLASYYVLSLSVLYYCITRIFSGHFI